MIFPRLFPLILASLILGAHFLRDGLVVLVVVCVLLPFLLLIRKRWVLSLLQACMVVGAIIWAQATYALVQTRIAGGESWTRMLLILAGVTLFTLWAGFLLRSPLLKELYPAAVGQDQTIDVPSSEAAE